MQNRLANTHIVERRNGDIHSDWVDHSTGVQDCELRVRGEALRVCRSQPVDNVCASRACCGDRGRAVRDDLVGDLVKRCSRLIAVVLESLKPEGGARVPLREDVWAGADDVGSVGESVDGVGIDHGDLSEELVEVRNRILELDRERRVAGDVHALELARDETKLGSEFWVGGGVVAELHVLRRHRAAGVEGDVVAQRHVDGQPIVGNRPLGRQKRRGLLSRRVDANRCLKDSHRPWPVVGEAA